MKITKLIKALEKVKAKHGDVEVCVPKESVDGVSRFQNLKMSSLTFMKAEAAAAGER